MSIVRRDLIARGLAVLVALASLVFTAPSLAVRVSTTGTGQVLLFPYYTTQNGNTSLISLVNTTRQGKAVRVNFRETRGGYVVAQLNVYLSAGDVWTAAVVGSSGGTRLVSNDVTCTTPVVAAVPPGVSPGLDFSLPPYQAQVDFEATKTPDPRREGYVEVIEMATIPLITRTGIFITHVAGVAPCGHGMKELTYEPPAADLSPPSGGLTGTLSIVNVGQGMLVSTAATALENFWLTGPGASAPRVWAANATQPGLDSGGDKEAFLHGINTYYTQGSPTLSARFAKSLDAVSAVLMIGSVYSEHAYTADGTIATTMVVTMPTKPYYIRSGDRGMFENAWNDTTAKSCDTISLVSYDREENTFSTPDFGLLPPRDHPQMCFVANVHPLAHGGVDSLGFPVATGVPDATFLGANAPFALPAVQDRWRSVVAPGREGGWLELAFTTPTANLKPLDASTVQITNGKPELVKIVGTMYGLPAIGFTLSQSAYKAGSPQQNFADAVPIRTQPVIVTGHP